MPDFIFLHHTDGSQEGQHDWAAYLSRLKAAGRFEGGSGIGDGVCVRKSGKTPGISEQIGGYIPVQTRDLEDAKTLLSGNPVYESGGAVEIRQLPKN